MLYKLNEKLDCLHKFGFTQSIYVYNFDWCIHNIISFPLQPYEFELERIQLLDGHI